MGIADRKILVYQPAYVWLGGAVAAVLLLTGAYLLFERGKYHAGDGMRELARQRSELEKKVDDLQAENVGLREQIAVLQRSSEIDRRASLDVRSEFAGLQDELLELRTEPGLRIQRFQLEAAEESGGYFYRLTLTQVKGNERYVRGVIEMEVEGLEDGKSKVLLFNKLAADNSKALKYKFRYFQNFEGQIWIPPQFEPKRVRILLKSSGKGQPPGIEKVVDWPA